MANKNTQLNQTYDVDDEIDLVDLIKTLWGSRRTIIKITAVVTFFSLIYAFLAPLNIDLLPVFILPQTTRGLVLRWRVMLRC